tara:strand:+ start:118 stop:369 length:252 start_codon:yes stop_codon:yes gene_type:complete
MGGILSKPKIPAPEPIPEETKMAQAKQRETLEREEQRAEQDRMKELTTLQARKRRARFGGRRMLLAERPMAELGIPKKDTLGG